MIRRMSTKISIHLVEFKYKKKKKKSFLVIEFKVSLKFYSWFYY